MVDVSCWVDFQFNRINLIKHLFVPSFFFYYFLFISAAVRCFSLMFTAGGILTQST